MIAEVQIATEQIKQGYPTSNDIKIKVKPEEPPVWQIDYSRYGGLKSYLRIRDMYWERFATGEQKTFGLLAEFRKDLHVKLDIPKKYDTYKETNY